MDLVDDDGFSWDDPTDRTWWIVESAFLVTGGRVPMTLRGVPLTSHEKGASRRFRDYIS